VRAGRKFDAAVLLRKRHQQRSANTRRVCNATSQSTSNSEAIQTTHNVGVVERKRNGSSALVLRPKSSSQQQNKQAHRARTAASNAPGPIRCENNAKDGDQHVRHNQAHSRTHRCPGAMQRPLHNASTTSASLHGARRDEQRTIRLRRLLGQNLVEVNDHSIAKQLPRDRGAAPLKDVASKRRVVSAD
jgi:hypothetical protein